MDKMKDLPWLPYLATGGLVVASIVIVRRLRTKKIPKYPKDTVILHMFPRGPRAPNASPFVLKLETYLRMAKIPYQVDCEHQMSKKGKSPWISYNEDDIADSHFCIEYLNKKFDVDLNSHLTAEQKGIGRAFQTLVEDNLIWVGAMQRWVYATEHLPDLLGAAAPKWVLKYVAPSTIKKQLHAQGMGRHTPKEVQHIGEIDMDAIEAFLGKKKFLLGDKATEFDCSLFGSLTQLLWMSPGSPQTRYMKEVRPRLVEYCERMKEIFWPDWDDHITHGNTKLENLYK